MDEFTELIGMKIFQIRKYKRLSQEEVALRGGLHPAQVGHIERNEKVPTISTLRKLAIGLNVDIADFFDVDARYTEEVSDEAFIDEFNKYFLQLDAEERKDLLELVKGSVRWKKKLQKKYRVE